MIAFDYIRLHVKAEINRKAPFPLSKDVYVALKGSITKNEGLLKSHTSKYSSNLKNSYQYIEKMNDFINNEYGRRIL